MKEHFASNLTTCFFVKTDAGPRRWSCARTRQRAAQGFSCRSTFAWGSGGRRLVGTRGCMGRVAIPKKKRSDGGGTASVRSVVRGQFNNALNLH